MKLKTHEEKRKKKWKKKFNQEHIIIQKWVINLTIYQKMAGTTFASNRIEKDEKNENNM
jgi:hypothetical protein